MPTKKELWAAQLAVHPNSVQCSSDDVFRWIEAGYSTENKMRRAMLVSNAIAFEAVVFYRVRMSKGREKMGMRYGIEPNQYMSGFENFELDKS